MTITPPFTRLLDLAAPPKTVLRAALDRLHEDGHQVSLTGDIPGLFRIDDGPEITTNQLIDLSGVARNPAHSDAR